MNLKQRVNFQVMLVIIERLFNLLNMNFKDHDKEKSSP